MAEKLYSEDRAGLDADITHFVRNGDGGTTGPLRRDMPGAWGVWEMDDTPEARAAGYVPLNEYLLSRR